MRKIVGWTMALAALLGALCLAFRAGYRFQTRDLAAYIPDHVRSSLAETVPWTRNASIRAAGRFVVMSPSGTDAASVILCPATAHPYPLLMVDESIVSGRSVPQAFVLVDALGRQIDGTDDDGDGIFDSCTVLTGPTTNRIAVSDRNLDGTFDVRLRVDGRNAVMVEDRWWLFRRENGAMIVDTPDGPKQVVFDQHHGYEFVMQE